MAATLTLGQIRIDRIVEHEVAFEHIRDFLPGIMEEQLAENRRWMQPWAMDARDWLIIDTCIGNDKPRPGSTLMHRRTEPTWMNGLAALGLTVADIDLVMCTHLHVDHVGWNTRLENGTWAPTFPKAKYLFSEKEFAYWQKQTTLGRFRRSLIQCCRSSRRTAIFS